MAGVLQDMNGNQKPVTWSEAGMETLLSTTVDYPYGLVYSIIDEIIPPPIPPIPTIPPGTWVNNVRPVNWNNNTKLCSWGTRVKLCTWDNRIKSNTWGIV